MTHGLSILHGNGNVAFSSDDVTWNQVDFFQVSANSSARRDYPVINGRSVLTVQMFINPPPVDRRALAHSISVSGTGVSVSGGSEDAYILVMMK